MHPQNKAAVEEISQTLQNARAARRATSILIGAGMSKTAGIPLALELVEEIKKKYPQRCRDLNVSAENLYGEAMAALAPNERRALLEPYMMAAKVNWAHIALAQLFHEGFISRIMSLNFDNLMIRASAIVGSIPAIYDLSAFEHAAAGSIVTPSILYLHGQSYGFKRLNTNSETSEHAERLRPVIADSLKDGPLICIGYSGGSDGVFKNISDLYRSDDRLYWLGREVAAPAHCLRLANEQRHFTYHKISDADTLMVDLARTLCKWPPLMFRRPISYVGDIANGIVNPISNSTESTNSNRRPHMRMPPESVSLSFIDGIKRTIKFYAELEISKLLDLTDNKAWEELIGAFAIRDDKLNLNDHERDIFFAAHMQHAAAVMNDHLGRFDKASSDGFLHCEALYRVATEIKSESPGAWHNLGLALLELVSRVDGPRKRTILNHAATAFRRALQLRASYPKAHAGLGKVGLERGRIAKTKKIAESEFTAGVVEFKKALRKDPKLHAARNNLAATYMAIAAIQKEPSLSKFIDQSVIEYQKLVADGYHLALYNLACCELRRGDMDACQRYLEECSRLGGMPHKTEILRDTDMDTVREKKWFKKLTREIKNNSDKKLQNIR
jgi:hypothetical protein